jgi:hypothetical protein
MAPARRMSASSARMNIPPTAANWISVAKDAFNDLLGDTPSLSHVRHERCKLPPRLVCHHLEHPQVSEMLN